MIQDSSCQSFPDIAQGVARTDTVKTIISEVTPNSNFVAHCTSFSLVTYPR